MGISPIYNNLSRAAWCCQKRKRETQSTWKRCFSLSLARSLLNFLSLAPRPVLCSCGCDSRARTPASRTNLCNNTATEYKLAALLDDSFSFFFCLPKIHVNVSSRGAFAYAENSEKTALLFMQFDWTNSDSISFRLYNISVTATKIKQFCLLRTVYFLCWLPLFSVIFLQNAKICKT